jgi:hypothetical protein
LVKKKDFFITGANRLDKGNDVSDLIETYRRRELNIVKTERSPIIWDIVVEGADHRIDDFYAAVVKLARDRNAIFDGLEVSPLRERDSTYG